MKAAVGTWTASPAVVGPFAGASLVDTVFEKKKISLRSHDPHFRKIQMFRRGID